MSQRASGDNQRDANSISNVVAGIKEIAEREDEIAISDIVSRFGDRSFAPVMLILALIGVTPAGGIPTVPTFIAASIALVAGQMVFGRKHIWLPPFIADRSVNSGRLRGGSGKLDKVAAVLDKLARDRLTFLAEGISRRIAASIIVILCCSVPVLEIVPFAAAAPLFSIAVLSLAIMVRDGLIMLIGGMIAGGALLYGVSWFVS